MSDWESVVLSAGLSVLYWYYSLCSIGLFRAYILPAGPCYPLQFWSSHFCICCSNYLKRSSPRPTLLRSVYFHALPIFKLVCSFLTLFRHTQFALPTYSLCSSLLFAAHRQGEQQNGGQWGLLNLAIICSINVVSMTFFKFVDFKNIFSQCDLKRVRFFIYIHCRTGIFISVSFTRGNSLCTNQVKEYIKNTFARYGVGCGLPLNLCYVLLTSGFEFVSKGFQMSQRLVCYLFLQT